MDGAMPKMKQTSSRDMKTDTFRGIWVERTKK